MRTKHWPRTLSLLFLLSLWLCKLCLINEHSAELFTYCGNRMHFALYHFFENNPFLVKKSLWNKVILYLTEEVQRYKMWELKKAVQHNAEVLVLPGWATAIQPRLQGPSFVPPHAEKGINLITPAKTAKKTHLRKKENKRSEESVFLATQIFGDLSLCSQPPSYAQGEHKEKKNPSCRREWRNAQLTAPG